MMTRSPRLASPYRGDARWDRNLFAASQAGLVNNLNTIPQRCHESAFGSALDSGRPAFHFDILQNVH
jgi:hypothetical protein